MICYTTIHKLVIIVILYGAQRLTIARKLTDSQTAQNQTRNKEAQLPRRKRASLYGTYSITLLHVQSRQWLPGCHFTGLIAHTAFIHFLSTFPLSF